MHILYISGLSWGDLLAFYAVILSVEIYKDNHPDLRKILSIEGSPRKNWGGEHVTSASSEKWIVVMRNP